MNYNDAIQMQSRARYAERCRIRASVKSVSVPMVDLRALPALSALATVAGVVLSLLFVVVSL